MNAPRTKLRSPAPRLAGVALVGAALSAGACGFYSWTVQHSEQACKEGDGICFTWWDIAVVPLSTITAFVVLAVVYKRLDIRPRSVVVPPTVLLAVVPLHAAQTAVGWWAAALLGGAWACSIALATWARYRALAVVTTAGLLLGSLVVSYG